ncbi:SEC14 [Symbiodinium natans]|uniref:SEC14 protein n=1 Tax=Symbiodinium natans TaxID=878477 RepID=A0A812RWY3_9DINO|nr:SEC14 [Symbiodinium natans]
MLPEAFSFFGIIEAGACNRGHISFGDCWVYMQMLTDFLGKELAVYIAGYVVLHSFIPYEELSYGKRAKESVSDIESGSMLRALRILNFHMFHTEVRIIGRVLKDASAKLAVPAYLALNVWITTSALFMWFENEWKNEATACEAKYAAEQCGGSGTYEDMPDVPSAMYWCSIFLTGEWANVDFTYAGSRLCIFYVIFGIAIFSIPVGILVEAVRGTLKMIALEEKAKQKAGSQEQSDPTAHYDLNLEHPQHRALLRMLLRRSQKLSTPMQELFAFEERGDEVLQGWSKTQSVPHKGHVSFAFRFPMELGSDQDATTLISRINEKRKLKVGLVDFVKVAQLFNSLADVEARLLFLEAMAADLNLKLSHVRYLSELDPVLRAEVVDRLLPAVPEINTLGGFDLAVNSVHQKASLCRDRAAIVNLLLFNPACADGRYEFDVTEPAHRKMLDDLIIVNHWERDRAKRLGRPDLSKHGDHECIRNCSVNGNRRVWRSADVQLPPRAEIKFDYCSPFHPPQGTPSTPDRTVRLLRQALTSMDFNQSLKVKVLRSVAHRLVLTPEQCGWLLEALPASALELDTEIRDSPRVEAFVVLYARCNDIAKLLSDEECGLYSLVHLTREEVLTVRKRLGRPRTWDITRAGQEFIIPPPEDSSDINSSGRMVLMTRRASNAGLGAVVPPTKPKSRTERMAEASIDEERMRPILKDYNMLDNPVSLGHANRYMMDLSLHEDWHCAQCLLRVCKEESGENIDAPHWSEKAHLADKGSKWLVPDEWYKEMPKVGIFGMTFLQGFNDPDMELRLRLAKEWLGW